jgi:competence ComEA-like helix-hairpin-helix protein
MRTYLRTGACALCLLAGGAHLQGQEKPSGIPDAPARAALKKICGNCHEVETVVASRRTRIGWERSVEDMVTRGAEGSDEDMAAIVDYLTAYFGKVNVNTALAPELEKLLGFSPGEAQAIVAYRERNNKIKDFEELKKVPGVSAEKLQAKRGLIAFSL